MPVSGGVRPGENRDLQRAPKRAKGDHDGAGEVPEAGFGHGAKIGNKEVRDWEVEACAELLKVLYESKLNAFDIKQVMREKKLTDVSGAHISKLVNTISFLVREPASAAIIQKLTGTQNRTFFAREVKVDLASKSTNFKQKLVLLMTAARAYEANKEYTKSCLEESLDGKEFLGRAPDGV